MTRTSLPTRTARPFRYRRHQRWMLDSSMCVDELTVIVDHHRNVSDASAINDPGRATGGDVARWRSAGTKDGRPLGDERADGFGMLG